MLRTRLGITLIVGVAAIGTVTGVALALSSDDPATDSGVLATGSTSKGQPYSISRMSDESLSRLGAAGGAVDIPSGVLCVEVEANGVGGGGCLAPPDRGTNIQPTQITLGGDMFVLAFATKDVDRLEVSRADGRGRSASATEAVDVGSLRLFHVVLDAPAATLPTTDGRPTSPVVDVEAYDSAGDIADRKTVGAPPSSAP